MRETSSLWMFRLGRKKHDFGGSAKYDFDRSLITPTRSIDIDSKRILGKDLRHHVSCISRADWCRDFSSRSSWLGPLKIDRSRVESDYLSQQAHRPLAELNVIFFGALQLDSSVSPRGLNRRLIPSVLKPSACSSQEGPRDCRHQSNKRFPL